MNKKNIIITGSSGFLGKHLGRALIEQGHSVKGIDLKKKQKTRS
jgi:nucleoside-diphosphate-sugar epimerase